MPRKATQRPGEALRIAVLDRDDIQKVEGFRVQREQSGDSRSPLGRMQLRSHARSLVVGQQTSVQVVAHSGRLNAVRLSGTSAQVTSGVRCNIPD